MDDKLDKLTYPIINEISWFGRKLSKIHIDPTFGHKVESA